MLEDLDSYIETIASPSPTYLKELERETHLKITKPQMLTGYSQGRILSFFSKFKKPQNILELGTFTGYGSLCLAEGLQKDGKLYTLEVSPENGWLAEKYFKISPFGHQIELIYGNALETIKTLNQKWDLVYIDADKKNNQSYFELVWPNVNPAGLVLIDNIFGRGGVFKLESEQKEFEKSIAAFNKILPKLATEGFVTILPIRDGLTIVTKE
jgi:caffeoyl-CoA O-methyltransferase